MKTDCFVFSRVRPGTEEYEDYLRTRYEIFCEELRRVSGSEWSTVGRPVETDEFDHFSIHLFARHRETGMPAACARLIMPNPRGLNVEKRYQITEARRLYPEANAANTCEISRMAVMPQFRRRRGDETGERAGNPASELPRDRAAGDRRRYQPELVLGMYREIYRLVKRRSLGYCMAAMDGSFARLLASMGFPLVPVGPVNRAVCPPRRPYMMSVEEVERALGERRPGILEFFMQG